MPQAQTLSIGRIVHYKLTEKDVEQIKQRRVGCDFVVKRAGEYQPGARAYVGNPPSVGDVLPLTIVRVWHEGINGQVMLDGNDTLWVTSVHEGKSLGQWQWPASA